MSFKSKMTAIADKLRALLGTSNPLTLDGMAQALDTQAAQVAEGFSAVAEMGGTVPVTQRLSTLPSAIRTISTGVEVKTASGSVTTNTSGTATITCGFKPDLLVIYISTTRYNGINYENNVVLAINERKHTNYTLSSMAWYNTESMIEIELRSVNTNGASIAVIGYDANWNSGPASKQTYQWKAIKYTM